LTLHIIIDGLQVKALPTISGLQSVHAAAITPRGKNGDINFGAIFELIDYLSAARVGGIALFTACGEYPALAVEERARVTYLAVKRSRVPVLAGVGSATLDHSLELAREARAAGVAAVLLPPPLYYQYDQDDICEFYTQFAAQLGSGPPIVLTGEIALATACRLLESGRFAGIDDGSGSLDSLDRLRACAPDRAVLAGDDRLLVHARHAGLGVLSAAACAAPELTMSLNSAIKAGDNAGIAKLEALRQELLAWLSRFPLPVGVKTAVAARGIQTGPLPVPLAPARAQCLEQFREWFKGWLPSTKKLASHA
jgi:dihydrodipicolinate synthase/N-acetylneuraminate lyase